MKKLKIFLLLSILLCFGFILRSEVHAQGGGPKVFEEGDVLPATTQLRISWDTIGNFGAFPVSILTENNSFDLIYSEAQGIPPGSDGYILYINNYMILEEDMYGGLDFESPYTQAGGAHPYIDIDTTQWSLTKRTVSSVLESDNIFYWEDLAPAPTGPKIFEEGNVLPAGYIKISWDFTDKFNDIFDEDVTFWIVGDGDPENNLYIEIEVWDYGEEVRFTINQKEFHIDTPGETVISIPIPYTITQVDANNDYDYYDSIGDALLWEVVTEEEFIYDQGYQDGYQDGYYLGYEHAREIYGYYDTITEQWLSVEEYLDLYGTDKMGQSDFYNNFDKYFIPAMIIVFGGAIVLTILKVFKGRE